MAVERKRLKIPSCRSGKTEKAGNLSNLNKFKKEAKKYKHQVAALKKKVMKFEEEKKDDDEEPAEDAGGSVWWSDFQ